MADPSYGTKGCNIQRTGSSGTYSYSVAPEWADRPVNFVYWGAAARFCNWLHNGQPTGPQDLTTTEVTTIDLNADLYEALETIMVKDFAVLPVVAPDDPHHLLGVISRRDIIGAYDKAVLKKSLFNIKSTYNTTCLYNRL